MAVGYDTQTTVFDASTGVPASLTVASNSNRLLVAVFCYTGTNANKVTSAAYTAGSGGSWTRLGGAQCSQLQISVEIWYSIAPSTGSVTITPTFTGVSDFLMTVASFYDADQTTGMNGFASADGSATVNVTTTSGDYAVAGLTSSSAHSPIVSGTQMGSGSSAQVHYTGRNAASGASTTIGWTTDTTYTITCGANVMQASGGGGGATLMGQQWT